MRHKQSSHPLIRAGKEPRPEQAIPSEAEKIVARLSRKIPKPHEELQRAGSRGQIGPKSLPPRRGTAK
jgi:hypothetical protein